MQLPDYHLTFEPPELAGLEVTMGRLTFEQVFELDSINLMPRTNGKQIVDYFHALAAFIGKHMVAWNLEDKDGSPLPLGQSGDQLVLTAIRDGWLQGITGAARPLGPTGTTDSTIESGIPMQPLPEPDGNESEPAGS